MDTFQMNPKAICADMAFFNPHMQAFDRMHNVKRLDSTLHGQTELRWVYDCSKSFSWYSWIQHPKSWTRPLWHKSLLPSWCADSEKHPGNLKWSDAHGVGHGTKTKSWHPHQPSRIFSMKKFKKWPRGLALKFSNEKISVEILLNAWSMFLPIFRQEKMCFIGKKIRAKSSKDGNLANGWRLKLLRSRAPWY